MEQIQITLPDGSKREYPKGVKPGEIAASLSQKLAKNSLAAKVGDKLVDLNRPINGDAALRLVTFDSPEGQAVYRHTTAHVLAQAVKRLFPEARLTIGPAIEDGFYYDFDVEKPFTPEDLDKIEAEMKKIIQENLPLERSEVSRKEAVALFKKADEPYKVELAEELPEGETITLYRQDGFVDLCAGPHLPSTGRVKAIKLLSAAGAYWRGDEHNRMLQRIYGTAFEAQKDLEDHLHKLEEAKRRDHRRLGKELDLFSIHEEAGPGLVFWHPKGGLIRELVENFWREEHRKRGYDIVYSPHIAKVDLWKTSGHWGWYRENMYSPMPIDEVEYLLKPMNCPFHILMFRSQTRSYRDLPLRWGELGTVYRYERSGVLHGLLRVRGFTQDDAHIFCRPDQLQQEIMGVIDLARFMMKSFGYKD
ncbi:MAG: threonine--tRNA ligase, partial [Bacillota bacterium]